MRIEQDTLDALAEKVYRLNSPLLHVGDYLRRVDAPADVRSDLDTARRLNNSVLNGLVHAGAEDPLKTSLAETRRQQRQAGYDVPEPKPTPLELLSSPAAHRYAEAIRAAALACLEMERERSIEDGVGEILSDYAEIAELECFGPKGLRGLE